MREHPIPQDIVGYRFHIVGNMTIKQFAEIGVGAFVAFLIYQTNLLVPIKWSLMAISFAIGAALAFVPFEERPLDHWLVTFIKVLYRPTKYYWKREAKIPDAFLYENVNKDKPQQIEIDLTPARRQRIKEYLMSVEQQKLDDFDLQRQQELSLIMDTFGSTSGLGQAHHQAVKPNLKVRVRSLRKGHHEEQQVTGEVKVIEEFVDTTAADAQAEFHNQMRESITLRAPLQVTEVAQDIVVPELDNVSLEQTVDQEAATQQQQTTAAPEERAYVQATAQPSAQAGSSKAVTFNQSLPFPTKPTQPNKLVGMILTPNNNLVNDAIIEIKNQSGSTVRAVKSNALGQFFVTTPLPNGSFTLEIDKQGLGFSPVSLTLNGQVVEPLEIRSVV